MKKHELQKVKMQRRMRRVRSKLHGTAERPRLSVHRSNRYMLIQAIDDDKAVTISALSDQKVKGDTKTERAAGAARQLAQTLKSAGVNKLVFDRGGYRYHGRVKAVAEALREAGIEV
jgi:large subunit ribosomal protein L18